MTHFCSKGKEIPASDWKYYFAAKGGAPVIADEDYYPDTITMEDLYQIFKRRFLAEQKHFKSNVIKENVFENSEG